MAMVVTAGPLIEFLLAKRSISPPPGGCGGRCDRLPCASHSNPVKSRRKKPTVWCRICQAVHQGQSCLLWVCTHIDKSHIHNHIIWSSVNAEYDRNSGNFWGSTRAVRRLSDTICIENGLSIVEDPKPHGKSYNKWLGEQAKPLPSGTAACDD